jgi:transposase
LSAAVRAGDVVLFTDWTLLRLYPPLRACWAKSGTQAAVPITGRNAKGVLFGAINLRTACRTLYRADKADAAAVCGVLRHLRWAYRRAGTIYLLADRASGHTAKRTQQMAARLGIVFVWLPKQWPELNAMDQLWRHLKQHIAANRQAGSIGTLLDRAAEWVKHLTRYQARRKAGMASPRFWLRNLFHILWQPT